MKKIINDIKLELDQLTQEGLDLSDIGNRIGMAIGKHITATPGFQLEDFHNGIKHGVSLADGSHDLQPGYIFAPYIPLTVSEVSEEYKKFISEYARKHALCPKCGAKEHSTTLVGYVLNMDKKEEYEDQNHCVCSNCGDKHTKHQRVEDVNAEDGEYDYEEDSFEPSESISSRYEKKKINPKYYGHIQFQETVRSEEEDKE